uniref:DDRGK domain-containing protein 1 n=1 Tax=Setaria digitata TaxID=48799 RepID=A0A915PSV7_9BILA
MIQLDYFFLGSVGFLVTALTLIVLRVIKLYFDEKQARQRRELLRAVATDEHAPRNERDVVVVGGRRVQTARRRVRTDVRNEVNGNADGVVDLSSIVDQASDASEQEDEQKSLLTELAKEHFGKKKLAKLQAKEERRKQREAELLEREERKKWEREKEERLQREREKELEKEEEERERKRQEIEEHEKREEEEYKKLRETFVVDEEGFDEIDGEKSQNLLRDFEEYIRKTKVVNIDELGACFNISGEDAMDRLNFLLGNGTLTGVMDDRGKFIYITAEELQAVAKFINQRGRVSKAELIEYSNKLIDLEPSSLEHTAQIAAV